MSVSIRQEHSPLVLVAPVVFFLFLALAGCGNSDVGRDAAGPVAAAEIAGAARFAHPDLNAFPSRLQARENRLVNAAGETVRLRGIMPPDLAVLRMQNRFRKELFAEMKERGANVIRIPVHPPHWVEEKDYLTKYLEPAVTWAGELGMYAIIDLHYIGNIATGAGSEMPKIDIPPKKLASEFWDLMSAHFKDAPHVLFEIFNEPAGIGPEEWKTSAEELIGIIRGHGAEQLVVVGGVEYAKDLSWVMDNPIRDANVAYACHIFPSHPKAVWAHWFGEVSKLKPVLITEWGYIDENRGETKQNYLIGDAASYGQPLMDAMNENGIGWVACWYDHEWEPPLLRKEGKELTNWGRFVLEQLKATEEN